MLFCWRPQINEAWEEQHAGRIIPLEEGEGGLYGIFDIVMDEEGEQVGVNNHLTPIPNKPFLNNNYPNPFNNTTQIEFGISRTGYVTLTVYDITGKWITNLVDHSLSSGTHLFTWSGIDALGNPYHLVLI